MARRHLKSPQSLYGTSTHPTRATHRSRSWSWIINSHPYCSMSISTPTPPTPPFSSNKAILNFDLETTRSRSWVRSKVKVTWFTQYPTDAPLRFTSIGPTIPEICPIVFVFDLEKTHPKFLKKIWQKKEFPTECLQNLIRWLAWPEGYSYQVL